MYGADGKAVRNAHFLRSNMLLGRTFMDFKTAKDPDSAKAEIAAEEKQYPDNLQATTSRWGMMMRDTPGEATQEKIKKELEPIYAAKKMAREKPSAAS